MEKSIILDFIQMQKLGKLREKLEAQEGDNFSQWLKESREAMEKNLDENALKFVDNYKHNLELREWYIDFQINITVLNYGIKIGMQLQQAFDEIDDL